MRVAPTPVKSQMFSVSQNLCGCAWVFELAGGLAAAGVAVGVPGRSCANGPPEQAKSKANNKGPWILDMDGILNSIAPACQDFPLGAFTPKLTPIRPLFRSTLAQGAATRAPLPRHAEAA